MKNKLKFLLGSLMIIGIVNTSYATDYIFTPKVDSEYYYSPTSVNVTTIKANNTNSYISSNISSPTVQYGDYTNIIRNEITSSVQYTSKNDVLREDGSIGTLRISEIGLNVKVYDGTTSNSMKKGVGHFSETSYWNGNIGLAGHNRGVNDNFGKLKKLSKGDVITYKTELGTRKYEVSYVGQIGVTDLSRLNPSSENMITLITCVENQPLLRLCVQAKELK
ncbi:MAG: class D sortase [Clostridiales bacterium]|nr:class D sortase [Clostridiales bacterium]